MINKSEKNKVQVMNKTTTEMEGVGVGGAILDGVVTECLCKKGRHLTGDLSYKKPVMLLGQKNSKNVQYF